MQRLPIATAFIECPHLVNEGMDITGARWRLDWTEAIRKLRLLKISGNLESYSAFHFEQDHDHNYPEPPISVVKSEIVR